MIRQLGVDVIKMYQPYKATQRIRKITKIGAIAFQIDSKFNILGTIGKGAYGFVVVAQDLSQQKKTLVAIKKIQKAFQHKIYAKRTLRQLKILRLLSHPNIIKLQQLLIPKSREQFNDVQNYAVSQFMEADLGQIIQSNQPLTQLHNQYLLYQLMKGVHYMHSANIVHRDLKPKNILVNTSDCLLKICDFGLSKAMFQKNQVQTDYMTTRWYRAPQILIGAEYSKPVDLWSVGCIFAEILLRKSFLKGQNTSDQLRLIVQTIGLSNIQKSNFLSQQTKKLLKQTGDLPISQQNNLKNIFKDKTSPQGIDLLMNLLKFNPEERIKVQQALQHPYFKKVRRSQQQITRFPINTLQFQFQQHNLTTEQFKDLLYEQILLYHSIDFCRQYEQKIKNNKSLIAHIINNSNVRVYDPIKDKESND